MWFLALQVWPGPSVFPDYMSSQAVGPWLEKKIDRFHKQVPWSGLWLDMNEASNFCTGMNCKPDHATATNMYCELAGVGRGRGKACTDTSEG